MKNIYKFLALLFLILLFTQCTRKEGRIIAEVNGEKLYEDEFRSLFTEQEWVDTSLDDKNEIIKDWIEITRESDKINNLITEKNFINVKVIEYHITEEDPDKTKKQEEWCSNIKKDIYIEEAMSIITNMINGTMEVND